jgi:hypothetical protein
MKCLRLARLILPSGYAIVPASPTNKMLQAAAKAMSPEKRPTQEWVSVKAKHAIRYKAMVEAYQKEKP